MPESAAEMTLSIFTGPSLSVPVHPHNHLSPLRDKHYFTNFILFHVHIKNGKFCILYSRHTQNGIWCTCMLFQIAHVTFTRTSNASYGFEPLNLIQTILQIKTELNSVADNVSMALFSVSSLHSLFVALPSPRNQVISISH